MSDHLILVDKPEEWTYLSCSGAREHNYIVPHEDMDDEEDIPCLGFNPLQHALWNKRGFHEKEVRRILKHLGAECHNNMSLRETPTT